LQVLTATGIQDAVCYIACEDKVVEGLTPEDVYKNHILCGSDLLGEPLSHAVSKAMG
jgi:hypothetical protein